MKHAHFQSHDFWFTLRSEKPQHPLNLYGLGLGVPSEEHVNVINWPLAGIEKMPTIRVHGCIHVELKKCKMA
jgi:hypothetical protein